MSAQCKDPSPLKHQREGEECVGDGMLALRTEGRSHQWWPPGGGSDLQLMTREKTGTWVLHLKEPDSVTTHA